MAGLRDPLGTKKTNYPPPPIYHLTGQPVAGTLAKPHGEGSTDTRILTLCGDRLDSTRMQVRGFFRSKSWGWQVLTTMASGG